ncbi:hypothetical protein DFH06DRAFT_1329216 [Mycena polygramma]|nr:hypothetical protein DFH06DRAFT_1329216 [Mycena polygramma]
MSDSADGFSLVPPASRAAQVAIPALGNGKRGPVVTRERFSSSPSFESQPREPRVVNGLDDHEEGHSLRLREFCVQPRTRPEDTPIRSGPTSWVNISAARSTLLRQDLRRQRGEQSSSDEDSDGSIPALVSPSDSSESSNDSESQTLPQTTDKILAGGTLVRELAYLLDRVTVAPPAPEVEDNPRGVLLAQSIRVAIDHNCYMSAWRTGRQLMPKGDKTESVGRVGHSPEVGTEPEN